MRIAVLGLGHMGSAMAARLRESGYDLMLWNRTRARAEALALGPVADTPAAAARGADVVLSSLTDAAAVRDVYAGPAGAREGASGQPFVEMSTTGPDVLRELAPALRERGSPLVDAPVLGTVTAVRAGRLLVLAGGRPDNVARVTPVLQALGEVRHTGNLGTAADLKLVPETAQAAADSDLSVITTRYEPHADGGRT